MRVSCCFRGRKSERAVLSLGVRNNFPSFISAVNVTVVRVSCILSILSMSSGVEAPPAHLFSILNLHLLASKLFLLQNDHVVEAFLPLLRMCWASKASVSFHSCRSPIRLPSTSALATSSSAMSVLGVTFP